MPFGLSFRLCEWRFSLKSPIAGLREFLSVRIKDRVPSRPGSVPTAMNPDVSWIDEFINNVRPYVFVRSEDNLLIKLPNQATKLNPQGVWILSELFGGSSIHRVFEKVGRDRQKVRDIVLFIHQVKKYLEGSLDEFSQSDAIDIQPFNLHFSRLPILSEIAVTYRCNLKCTFCYAGCNCTANPTGDNREMTATQIREVLCSLYEKAKVPSVSFTGGEATLRKDLPDLVEYAAKLGMRVNLITNGVLVSDALARDLASAGLASAQVSLEGVCPETHEALTQVPGSFRKTIEAVRCFSDAGIRVHTHTTINRDNLSECAEMARFVRRDLNRERFSMNILIPAGSANLAQRLIVSYTELGPTIEEIIDAARRESVEFMWYSPTPMCLFNPVAHQLGNKGCSACDGLISIAANGDVLPCSSCNDPVGNLLAGDILEIWNSQRACWYRNKQFARKECQQCENFRVCNGACPIYWRELGYRELESHESIKFEEAAVEHVSSEC
jgi:radical SAM protein with 4Fe4S-binding SPASM domain